MLYTEDGVTVVGEASSGEEAMEKIPMTRPNVAVLDVRLGNGMSGVEVCRDVRSAHPEIACVMLTSFADDEALFASIMAGAADTFSSRSVASTWSRRSEGSPSARAFSTPRSRRGYSSACATLLRTTTP